MAILVFFQFPFAWNIFLYPFTFSLCVSLDRSWVVFLCSGCFRCPGSLWFPRLCGEQTFPCLRAGLSTFLPKVFSNVVQNTGTGDDAGGRRSAPASRPLWTRLWSASEVVEAPLPTAHALTLGCPPALSRSPHPSLRLCHCLLGTLLPPSLGLGLASPLSLTGLWEMLVYSGYTPSSAPLLQISSPAHHDGIPVSPLPGGRGIDPYQFSRGLPILLVFQRANLIFVDFLNCILAFCFVNLCFYIYYFSALNVFRFNLLFFF